MDNGGSLSLGKDSQGEEVIKPYTPTTLDSDVGHFELVIKMYPQGRMSHHFREMREGEFLTVKGPKPPEVWNGGIGFVSIEMIQAHCPAPASNIQCRERW
ncbi:hypothetical protein CASFOL_001516 [Castilleja foliolosa]|uniref:Flavoprotein pyridine nucleotide cytochrome reductase-like FAD-binding domain-containing protein n=1 Tax=Castilleja foliolosa TaxID=1961234 RepID=A0ABD3EJV5_9LAMI